MFLVEEDQGEWLKVLLPIRPNGSTGFVRASDVTVSENPYSIDIELAEHRLTVSKGDEVTIDEPIGVGTASTPTPGGKYYLKELLQPPDPNGTYGPYAYGLSGFSNVLQEFNGGDGVIGIHGTNQPEAIGTDVSHGCIRVSNEAITEMAGMLPLGTPVHIWTDPTPRDRPRLLRTGAGATARAPTCARPLCGAPVRAIRSDPWTCPSPRP